MKSLKVAAGMVVLAFAVFALIRARREFRDIHVDAGTETALTGSGNLASASAPEVEQNMPVVPAPANSPVAPASPFRSPATPDPTLWFAAPERASDGRYVVPELAIEWSADCPASLKRHASVAAFAKATAGLHAETQFPRDLHVEELTQFWSEGGVHRQVSIIWEQDDPATYRIESYRSETADFSSGVASVPVAGLRKSERADVERALKTVDAELEAAKQRGAKEGARILLARANSRKPDGVPFTARFVNGRATEFRGAGFACEANTRAACRCASRGGDE